MEYQSFKGRVIDQAQRVEIYKNLHNGLFSIRQNGLVVGHAKSFHITDVSFKVSNAGRQRVLKEKQKNIHAFICGRLLQVGCISDNNSFQRAAVEKQAIKYNPYTAGQFFRQYDGVQSGIPCNVIIEGLYLMGHSEMGITFRQFEASKNK